MDSREGPDQSAGWSVEQRLRELEAVLQGECAAFTRASDDADRAAAALRNERMRRIDAEVKAQLAINALWHQDATWEAEHAMLAEKEATLLEHAPLPPGVDDLLARTQAQLRKTEDELKQARATADACKAEARREAARADANAQMMLDACADVAAATVALQEVQAEAVARAQAAQQAPAAAAASGRVVPGSESSRQVKCRVCCKKRRVRFFRAAGGGDPGRQGLHSDCETCEALLAWYAAQGKGEAELLVAVHLPGGYDSVLAAARACNAGGATVGPAEVRPACPAPFDPPGHSSLRQVPVQSDALARLRGLQPSCKGARSVTHRMLQAFDAIPVGATLQHTASGEKLTLNAERQVVSTSGVVDASIDAWWARVKQPEQWPPHNVRVNGVTLLNSPYYTVQPRGYRGPREQQAQSERDSDA